jgi:hypothetical protein
MVVGTRLALCGVTAVSVALQGCSLLFVEAPPPDHAELRAFDCTSSVAAPVIDTVVAGFQAVRTAVAVGANDSVYENYPLSRPADIAFGLGFLALFTGSAIYGYSETGDCRQANRELQARVNTEPHPYAPPPAYAPAQPVGAPPPGQMCSYDTQCKADRVCDAGRCVPPPLQPMFAPPAAPAPPAQPTPPTLPPAAPAPPPAAPAPQSPAPAPVTAPAPSTPPS